MVVVVSWHGQYGCQWNWFSCILLMMWLLTKAAGWILKCFGQYYLLIFSQMLQKLIGRRFTVQMDNDPKSNCKSNQRVLKGKKWTVMQWPSQSPDLNPIEHAFHLLKTKLKGKCPKNKQELKTVAVEAWQSITRDETQRLVMSMRYRLQAESIYIPYIHNVPYIYIYIYLYTVYTHTHTNIYALYRAGGINELITEYIVTYFIRAVNWFRFKWIN